MTPYRFFLFFIFIFGFISLLISGYPSCAVAWYVRSVFAPVSVVTAIYVIKLVIDKDAREKSPENYPEEDQSSMDKIDQHLVSALLTFFVSFLFLCVMPHPPLCEYEWDAVYRDPGAGQ